MRHCLTAPDPDPHLPVAHRRQFRTGAGQMPQPSGASGADRPVFGQQFKGMFVFLRDTRGNQTVLRAELELLRPRGVPTERKK